MSQPDNLERRLSCILFPGVVKNDDRAIECLGGIRTISHIYSQTAKKRLGLSFQPENPFVKRIFGESRKTAGILLKVRVKKIKSDGEIKKEVLSTTVVGRVNSIYKFEAMCDFQYLPVQKEDSGSVKCHLESVIPTGIDSFDFLTQPSPLFIVPAYFTRTDKPNNYSYTDKRYYFDKNDQTSSADDNIHNRTRSFRKGQYSCYVFSLTNELPTVPHEAYVMLKNARAVYYPQLEDEFGVVKKMFDERPIWSFNLIKYETKIRSSSLKLILPCLAVYMRKGPWKMVWTRFGYDPRKEPASRVYQTLDFRVRSMAGINSMVTTREEYNYKKVNRSHKPKKSEDCKEVPKAAVIFEPGLVPTQRQAYYQYCDIKLPEVVELISAEPAPGYLCHQTRGWLPPNTDQICRDLVFKYVKETLLATHNADFKLEEGSSDDDGSDYDDTTTAATVEEVV